MNFNEMQNMMGMMESMKGKSPIDIVAENNPRMAQMRGMMQNPAEMLAKMGGAGNLGDFNGQNGVDIASVMGMMGNMQKNRGTQKASKIYYGLAPIAGFATAEIVYELNRYLSSVEK